MELYSENRYHVQFFPSIKIKTLGFYSFSSLVIAKIPKWRTTKASEVWFFSPFLSLEFSCIFCLNFLGSIEFSV